MYNERRLAEEPIPEGPVEAFDNEENDENDENQSIEVILIPADVNNSANLNNGAAEMSNPLNMSLDCIDGAETVPNTSNVSVNHLNVETSDDESASVATNAVNVTSNDLGLPCDQITSPIATLQDNGSGDFVSESVPSTSVSKSVGENNTSAAIIPSGDDNENDASSFQQIQPVDAIDDVNNDASLNGEISSDSPIAVEPTANVTAENSMQQNDQSSSRDNSTNDEVIVEPKPELDQEVFPIYEADRANNDDILDALDDRVVEVWGGLEVTYKASKGIGMPLKTMTDGRLKLEEPDVVSGMIPFITSVS